MNLRVFHIVFIVASLGLSFLLAGWNFRAWNLGGAAWHLWLAVACALAGVGLVVYGQWFFRKVRSPQQERARRRKRIRPVPLVLLALWFAPRAAEACTVCYGEAEGPMIDGARIGVFVLYGLVLFVQIGLIAFFLTLRRRAKRYAESNAAGVR